LRNLLAPDMLLRFCEQVPCPFVGVYAMNSVGILAVQLGSLTTIVAIAAFGAAGTLYCALFGRDLPTLTPKPNASRKRHAVTSARSLRVSRAARSLDAARACAGMT